MVLEASFGIGSRQKVPLGWRERLIEFRAAELSGV
jgi:hypothetical protein